MSDRDRLSGCAALATLLTSSGLFAVFRGAEWVPALAGVIAVVAGCSVAARRLRLPAVLAPVLIGTGVTAYVTLLFASSAAVAGIVPGPGALRVLGSTADQGFADIQALAPPVPTRPGLLLITVVSVALVAAAADLLATSLSQPPAAGLPLLALFAVPSALAPGGTGIVPFALAVTGYLLLLAADGRSRLARWGRPVRPGGRLERVSRLTAASYGDEQPTGAMGRRIGLTALGLAMVVPLALPSMGTPLFGGTGGAGTGSGRGGNSVTTYNPIVRLHDHLTARRVTTLLTLRTDEVTPTGYLRMAGLDIFDGRTWSQSSLRASTADRLSVGRVLPPPPRAGADVATTITVSDRLDARWLPLPYQPTAVRISGDWRYEGRTGTVFSTRSNAQGKRYSVVSAELRVDPATLDSATLGPSDQALFAPYTAYPANLPSVIKQTADAIVTKADATTPYQRAVALQKYFRSDAFRYSLSVPAGNSRHAIVNFLKQKQGFCEQFAATMALFARLQGIPARVAVGFTYGEKTANGENVVTTRDAHAWPELYFSKAGWLPFEPTPEGGRGTTVAPAYTNGATDGAVASPQLDPSRDNRSPEERRFGSRLADPAEAVPSPEEALPGSGPRALRLLGWLGLLPIVLAVPALVRMAVRRRRWRAATSATAAAHAAWCDLRDDARDLGLVWPASASPRGAADWLRSRVTLSPGASCALADLVRAEERARYRRAPLGDPTAGGVAGAERRGVHRGAGRTPGKGTELRHLAATLRSALREQVAPRRRWRARLLPASATDQIWRLTSRVAAAGDQYDRNLARWTRSLFRRRPATP